MQMSFEPLANINERHTFLQSESDDSKQFIGKENWKTFYSPKAKSSSLEFVCRIFQRNPLS
ncbi:hypothetical protein ACTXT7_005553 [Hymenolepis weldensis]